MSLVESRWLTSAEFAAAAGLTYRQVDYWARTGVPAVEADGSGSRRVWDAHLVPVARLLGVIVATFNTGTPKCKGPISDGVWRRLVEAYPDGQVDLGEGIRLVWDPDQLGAA